MKHIFYTLLILGSAGTVVCITNPELAEQGAERIGLKLQLRSEEPKNEEKPEDKLSQFLSQYPFAGKNKHETEPVGMNNTTEPAPVIAQPFEPVAQHFVETPASPGIQPTALRNDTDGWDSAEAVPVEPNLPQVNSVFVPDVQVANETSATQDDPFLTNAAPMPPVSVYEQMPESGRQVAVSELPMSVVPQPPIAEHVKAPPPAQNAVEYTVESIPCHGTDMVARVGTQFILMCDILPRLRRAGMKVVSDNLEKMPEAERKKVPQVEKERFINAFIESQYPAFLKEQIQVALIFNDYAMSKPLQERETIEKNVGDDFDQTEVPEMMKEFGVQDLAALKQFLLNELGSSLERERDLWTRDRIAQQWAMSAAQQANGECTYEQLRQYYDKNLKEFTSEAKAKWLELVVLFSKYPSQDEALRKMQWMGNQVANGAPFEAIAKANSDGFTASKGGLNDWTTKGSMASAELEQAVFSQPVGQLSPQIIRGEKSLHIIRVVQRQDEHVTPFVEAQVTIRERIKTQRRRQYQENYFAELRQRYPIIIIKDRIDFALGTKTSSLQ